MLLRAVNNQYENEELNKLSDMALATFDRSEQEAYYREMQVISHRDVAVVPIAHSDYTAVVLKGIKGFELDPLGNIIARRVSF